MNHQQEAPGEVADGGQKRGYNIKFGEYLGVTKAEFGRSGVQLAKFAARNSFNLAYSIGCGVFLQVVDSGKLLDFRQ